MFWIAVLKNILNLEFSGVKEVDLGLQITTGSGNPSPGYASIQGSPISGLTRLPQAWLICVSLGEVLMGGIAWDKAQPQQFSLIK